VLEEFVGHPSGLAADGDGQPSEVVDDDGGIEYLDERAFGVALKAVAVEAGGITESEAITIGTDDGGGARHEWCIAECVGGGAESWWILDTSGDELTGDGTEECGNEEECKYQPKRAWHSTSPCLNPPLPPYANGEGNSLKERRRVDRS
jgi:hypothetical protein